MMMLKYSYWAVFTLLWGIIPGTFFGDYYANVAALLAGFFMAFVTRTPGIRRADVFWNCVACGCVALTIASFAALVNASSHER
jgi:hypothetical protein